MKFLTLVFCAAALTASSAYGMNTPAKPTNAPKKSTNWQKHAILGTAKLIGLIGTGLTLKQNGSSLYHNPRDRVFTNTSLYFLSQLGSVTWIGYSAYKSLSKAFTKYQEA